MNTKNGDNAQNIIRFISESKDNLELMIQQPDAYEDRMKNLYTQYGFEDNYDQIHEFFSRIDDNYSDVLYSKNQGISTESWFNQKIELYNNEQSGFLPGFLKNVENEMKIEAGNSISSDQSTAKLEKFEAKKMVKSLFELIKFSTNLNTISSEKHQHNMSIFLDEELLAIQKAVESKIGNETDVIAKEFITLAMLNSQSQFSNSALQAYSATQVAAVVDSSYSIFKVGYHLATGTIRTSIMTEYLIDRAAARIEALIHVAGKSLGTKMGAKIGKVVGSVLGPTGATLGNYVGAAIGGMVGEKIARMASNGLQKITPILKEKANRIFEKVSNHASSLVNNVIEWIGR